VSTPKKIKKKANSNLDWKVYNELIIRIEIQN